MRDHPFFSLFENPADWQVVASGLATGVLSSISDADGRLGLRLEYDFHGGGGFVAIRRALHFRLPETFEIGFDLRGEGPPNHFEFKVADPANTNVWRYRQADFSVASGWRHCRVRERDLPFAWGPAGGGGLSEVGAVEFVIAAGSGGKGFLDLGGLSLEDETFRQPLSVHATSHQPGFPAEAVFTLGGSAGWRAADDDDEPIWLADFGRAVRFGGLVIDWPEDLPPRSYVMETSVDGETWMPVHHAVSALGARSHIPVPHAEVRHLRIAFGNPGCAALRAISLRPDSFSSTPNEFIHHVAADYPRGWFPRYWHRAQSYWTPVGSPEGIRRALINEEGMVEIDEAGFSLEPFVVTPGGFVTWAEAKCRSALARGGLPVPSVAWKTKELKLDVLPWVDGRGDNLTLHVSYRLKLRQPSPGARLVITVRPFQVNPPWQAFRNLGGRSPIHRIDCETRGIRVEDREVVFSKEPDSQGAATFEEGGVIAFLADGQAPPRRDITDESGLGSAAMIWNVPSGKSAIEVTVSVPYFGTIKSPTKTGRASAVAGWRKTLGGVRWQVPKCAAPAFDAFRTAAGHILINRDGPAIQPGPRRYTRSWVRDCVIMGAALAKAGLPDALREFLTWYVQFQREDGFIPCVVDRDGVDWIVEHDSHGQFLWGVREVFRNGGDRKFVAEMMPHVRKAADYLVRLRNERMTSEYQSGEHAACYGLLPESASHEGYLAHPVHSYWDDFWGVRGLEAAAELAETLHLTNDAGRWRSEVAQFQFDLLRSIEKVIAGKQLNYIPGSVEWADFDPTATSNAIALLDFAGVLPDRPLREMLDAYLDGHHRKHRGEMEWNNYTAYEIRIIGAFVRLGRRDVANELLQFFLSDQRPAAWNQWPEITWRDPCSPGHLGDVPHTWIAAEYLLALASMVASEREATDSMVLAAGMPWSWISEGEGFAVQGLPTRYGVLDFKMKARGTEAIDVEVGGLGGLPPGGLTIEPPLPPGMAMAGGRSIDVKALPFQATLKLESQA